MVKVKLGALRKKKKKIALCVCVNEMVWLSSFLKIFLKNKSTSASFSKVNLYQFQQIRERNVSFVFIEFVFFK